MFVQLQRADSSTQILPFDPISTDNPITVPKNLPYDDSLSHFLQYPTTQSNRSRYIQVYSRLVTTVPPRTVKQKLLPYLRQQGIFMQKNDVPSSNLVISAWIHCQHPDYVNGLNLKKRMITQLGGFDQFQLNVRNSFKPVPTLQATTRTWILEMDSKIHDDHFGKFLEQFHSDNEIVVVPCQGYNTWDSDLSSTKKLITNQNIYLQETTATTIDYVQNVDEEIIVHESTTTFAKYLKQHINQQEEIVLDVCQYNANRINVLTKHGNTTRLNEILDKFFDNLPTLLSPEARATLFHDSQRPIRHGRDLTLPSTINFYKQKLTATLDKRWADVATADTASTADSTVITFEKSKVTDLESKFSELSESHALIEADFKCLTEKHEAMAVKMADQFTHLSNQILNLTNTINEQNKQIQDKQEQVNTEVKNTFQEQQTLTATYTERVNKILSDNTEKVNASIKHQQELFEHQKQELHQEIDRKLDDRFATQMLQIDLVIKNFHNQLMTDLRKTPHTPPHLTPPPNVRRKTNLQNKVHTTQMKEASLTGELEPGGKQQE